MKDEVNPTAAIHPSAPEGGPWTLSATQRATIHLSARGISRWTWVFVVSGVILRLFLIFPGPFESPVGFLANKADLRNYYWPAQAALQGQNPYKLWSSGQSGEFRADMAPLELLTYVATIAVWNDPRAIQILFAIFDALNIVLLGVLLKSSPLRLPFQIFYALGPLTLYNLVLVPEDKTIVITLTLLIFILLTRNRRAEFGLLIAVATVLASFKWLSVFYLLPLLLHVSRDWRYFFKYGLLFGAIVSLAHLPWFPAWSYVYVFRSARTATPIHIAPAALLNAAGLYNSTVLLMVLGLSLLAIYALYCLKRLDIYETIALSVAVGVLWTPDMDPVHLGIVVIGLLLVVEWGSRLRLFAVWAGAAWVALVYAISTHTGFTRFGLPNLWLITGEYGSPQMILLSYVLFVAVLGFYLWDKWRRRPVGAAILGLEPQA